MPTDRFVSISSIQRYDELWECTHDPETMRRIAMLCPPSDRPPGPFIIESTPCGSYREGKMIHEAAKRRIDEYSKRFFDTIMWGSSNALSS